MSGYLRAIWGCRFFWFSLVRMDLRTRYRGSVLGLGWSLLQPIAMTIILCTVFSQLFKAQVRWYGPFLLSGLTLWNFMVNSSLQGCQAFFQAESYIRQYPAPMAIYPLRITLGSAFHFLLALCVVVPLSWLMNGFNNLPALPYLVPALLLLVLLGWALAIMGAVANVHFQDTQHLLDVGLQILFYASPIMYEPKMLEANKLGWILNYNPVVVILKLFREPILYGRVPSLDTYVWATLTVLVTLTVAMVCLRRLERHVVFHL
jgi:lipopolysaccharide transport system permease protein